MAASLQAAATLMQPTKLGVPARNTLQLRSSQGLCKAFGLEPASSRFTCSLQADLKDLAHKCVDATKIAGFALATSALIVSVSTTLRVSFLFFFFFCFLLSIIHIKNIDHILQIDDHVLYSLISKKGGGGGIKYLELDLIFGGEGTTFLKLYQLN